MLIGILKMPPCRGEAIDRRIVTTVDKTLRSVGAESHNFWLNSNTPHDLCLGSFIQNPLSQMFKLIHLSHDGEYVFETVVAVDDLVKETVYLYTKIISKTVEAVTSLEAIGRYAETRNRKIPLSTIIGDHYWNKVSMWDSHDIHSIIPVINDRDALDDEVMHLVSVSEEGGVLPGAQRIYNPLYIYHPGILEGLMLGKTPRSPFQSPFCSVHGFSPSRREPMTHKLDGTRWPYVSDKRFDGVTSSLITMRPSDLSVTMSIEHALDGHIDLSVTNHMYDEYTTILPMGGDAIREIRDSLGGIFHKCAKIYCQSIDISPRAFSSVRYNKAFIHLEKNIYDEVRIVIFDERNAIHKRIYTNFTTLALSTLSAGHYL